MSAAPSRCPTRKGCTRRRWSWSWSTLIFSAMGIGSGFCMGRQRVGVVWRVRGVGIPALLHQGRICALYSSSRISASSSKTTLKCSKYSAVPFVHSQSQRLVFSASLTFHVSGTVVSSPRSNVRWAGVRSKNAGLAAWPLSRVALLNRFSIPFSKGLINLLREGASHTVSLVYSLSVVVAVTKNHYPLGNDRFRKIGDGLPSLF